MSPYLTDKFLPEIRELNRLVGALTSPLLADLVGKPERTVRHWLRQLEQAGLVARPYGKKKGWTARGRK